MVISEREKTLHAGQGELSVISRREMTLHAGLSDLKGHKRTKQETDPVSKRKIRTPYKFGFFFCVY